MIKRIAWILLATAVIYMLLMMWLGPSSVQPPYTRTNNTRLTRAQVEVLVHKDAEDPVCGYVSVHTGPRPNEINVGDTLVSELSWNEVLNQSCEMWFRITITKSQSDPKANTPLIMEGIGMSDQTFNPITACQTILEGTVIECKVPTQALGAHRFYLSWRAERYGWVEVRQEFFNSIGQPVWLESGWVEQPAPTPTPVLVPTATPRPSFTPVAWSYVPMARMCCDVSSSGLVTATLPVTLAK